MQKMSELPPLFQDVQAGHIRRAITVHGGVVQMGVTASLALYLQLSRPHDSSSHLRAGFAATVLTAQTL